MPGFTAAEQALIDVWDAHTAAEFERKDADAAIATMTEHPVLIHVPVGTGATGREPLRKFYREIFIPQMPPDFKLELLTRSVGQDRVVDEFIVRFTHTVRMDWFAPGIAPTRRRLVVPHVGIVAFEGGKSKLRAHLLGPGHGPAAARDSPRRSPGARCRAGGSPVEFRCACEHANQTARIGGRHQAQ